MRRETSKRLALALAIASIAVLTTGCGPQGPNPGILNNPLGAPGMLTGGCLSGALTTGPISIGYQGQASGQMSPDGMGMVSGMFQTSGAGAIAPPPTGYPTAGYPTGYPTTGYPTGYPTTGYPYGGGYNYAPVTLSGQNASGSTITMIIQSMSSYANGTLTLNGTDIQMLRGILFPYANMPMPTTGYGYGYPSPTYPTSPYGYGGGYGGYGYNQQACVSSLQVQLNIGSGRLYMGTVGLNFSTGQQYPVNF